jgi:hypothetical protein
VSPLMLQSLSDLALVLEADSSSTDMCTSTFRAPGLPSCLYEPF